MTSVATTLAGLRAVTREVDPVEDALDALGPDGTLVVAALYHDELVAALPFEDHDRRVHAVVTPAGVTRL